MRELIKRHAGHFRVQQLFVRIGKGAVLRQIPFLALAHLKLLGMHIGHVGVGGRGGGTGHDLLAVVVNTETEADQNPAVAFTSGDGDIFIGTLFNIFAVERQNPSAARTNRMNCRFVEMDDAFATGSAGGGMVTVKVTGKRELTAITIDPQVVDPDDIDMLQDLILAAVNEALRKGEEARETAMNRMAPGMGGLF